MTDALHHLHKRKRIHNKLEQYPHPHISKRVIDRLVYIAGIVGPIMSIPQVLRVWVEQEARGISLISYSSYIILDLVWITYGLVHKEKPIVIMYILWTFVNISIVVGALTYG
jgi:uncharacterized protein with PQ loop repeat